jgi:hypothetical protein
VKQLYTWLVSGRVPSGHLSTQEVTFSRKNISHGTSGEEPEILGTHEEYHKKLIQLLYLPAAYSPNTQKTRAVKRGRNGNCPKATMTLKALDQDEKKKDPIDLKLN